MAVGEGLRRVAKVVHWLAIALAVIAFLVGLGEAVGPATRGDRFQTEAIVVGIVVAIVLYGIGAALAWVIDGFASKKERAILSIPPDIARDSPMPTSQRPSSHDWLWWLLLLPLLTVVLGLGLYVVLIRADRFPLLLGIAAFSIAYALHFFSVSSALCGVYIREDDESKVEKLRKKEYAVVTSAMCALAGGLGILLSGGLCAIDCSATFWGLPLVPVIYAAAAVLLFMSVLQYVLTQRQWPRAARKIRISTN